MTTYTSTAAITVSMDKAPALVLACIRRNKPVMLWGAPGIGKSDLMKLLAVQLGLPLHTFIASIKTPVDLSGIPVADMEKMLAVWLRAEDIPDYPCLFFIDEINACAPAMQAALFQLVLERRVGKHRLHPDTVIVAAGNRMGDRAAAQRMPTALRNRFAHFNVEPTVSGYTKWASANGVDPYLVAFLNFRQALLHIMPGQTVDDGEIKISMDVEANAFPTPRSWTSAGEFLNEAPELRQMLVAAHVGEGPAAELEGFLRVCHSVPTLDDVIANPKTAKVPAEGDAASRYAICALICRSATRENFDVLLQYAARLGREFEVLTAVDAVKRHPELATTGAFGTWAVGNQDITL
jgi:hypothetical protein